MPQTSISTKNVQLKDPAATKGCTLSPLELPLILREFEVEGASVLHVVRPTLPLERRESPVASGTALDVLVVHVRSTRYAR